MTKHTPAPWKVSIGEAATVREKDGLIAIFTHLKTVTGGRRDSDEVAANARLAAAAPELLDALQGMLGAWNMVCDANGWERDHLQQQKDAVAAIEKATKS